MGGRRTSARSGYPGRVRIIAGRWRGRRLPVPHAEGLRPTPDRVRETLFNWLEPYIAGAHCLDLFAGTGALCLEALSRGAARAVMVERSAAVAGHLRALVAQLGGSDEAQVVNRDALAYLHEPPQPFDVVFLDPPFARAYLIGECAALIERRCWLKPGGFAYIEAPAWLRDLGLPPSWEIIRHGRAGEVGYYLARRVK